MLRLLVDTCVWLDLAKDIRGETLIASTRVLVHGEHLELLVPQLVIDEYERKREQVIAKLGTSTRSHIKLAKAALAEHGRGERNQELVDELGEVAMGGPLIEQLVQNRFGEVLDLLVAGRRLEPSDDDRRAVIDRGLAKRAPFHAKASVADALLVEMYGSVVDAPLTDPADQHGFVSHNTSDFSDPKDTRKPHTDLAEFFRHPHSTYFTSLKGAYAGSFSDEFAELVLELDFVEEDPRSGREILEAEQRIFDLLWYQFSRSGMHPEGEAGRKRIEATYPAEELGPYTDYEFGMLQGKLSALRWVTGSEWDFLDL